MEDIHRLSFSEGVTSLRAAGNKREREERGQLQAAGFTAWRHELSLSSVFGGEYPHKTFRAFLVANNLLSEKAKAIALERDEMERQARKAEAKKKQAEMIDLWKKQLK